MILCVPSSGQQLCTFAQAQPMWQGNPYIVHESDQPLTVPEDPHLATEIRAVDRQVFDQAVDEKMRAQEVTDDI